jgi:hypothetical protein
MRSEKTKSREKKKTGGSRIETPTGSREAMRSAAVILEVLAGTASPSEAAQALGISTPRYFVLESRAIAALVAGCEPRPRGYVKTAEKELEALRKQQTKLKSDCARYQALARVARRTAGVTLPTKQTKGRVRKPVVRALRLAKGLKAGGKHQQTNEEVNDGQGKASQGTGTG